MGSSILLCLLVDVLQVTHEDVPEEITKTRGRWIEMAVILNDLVNSLYPDFGVLALVLYTALAGK